MNIPVHDYTARGASRSAERGGRGVEFGPIDPYNNEWVLMQQARERESLYKLLDMVLPVHASLGSTVEELGSGIINQASGRGTSVAKHSKWRGEPYEPSPMDKLASLGGTWTGNAIQDLGDALQMSPEDLIKLRQSVLALQDNPELQSALLQNLAQGLKARYGSGDGVISAAEDFGGPGMAIAAGRGGKALGKIFKLGQQKGKGADLPITDPDLPPVVMGGVGEGVADELAEMKKRLDQLGQSDPNIKWAPSDAELAEWLKKEDSKGLDSEGYVEGENVDPAMVKKSDLDKGEGATSFDILDTNKTLEEIEDALQAGDVSAIYTFSDSDIDKAIQDINKKLNTNPPADTDWLDDALDLFVSERHKRKRRKDKGEGGSAGAQKTQTELQQMMQIERKVQQEVKDITPVGGLHHEYFNKGAFDKDADLGNIDRLLGQGKFVSKRNTWHFPEDADPAVFSLNAFMSRMYQHQHEASSDEVIILMDILERAQNLPSKRKLSSMAEDIYKMISGPTKKLLAKEYGGSSPLGFDF